MNAIICMKQVPDTETRFQVRDGKIVEEGIQYVVNPYDEYAIEECLLKKEAAGEGQVTVICLGSERAREAILQALALGCDQAIHLDDPAFGAADAFVTAQVLAAAIKKVGAYDFVFTGKQGVDHDNAQVGILLAEMLDLPHVSVVTRLEIGDGKATAQREVEGGKQVVATPLPAVFSAQKGLNEPRYPSFRGIRQAKSKPYTTWTAADLGLDPAALVPKSELVSVTLPPERGGGKVIGGEPAEAAKELVRLLREEAKVI
ncbi:MAG: electron transfer flavoprotein subunit beta/FixA family protein [Chloroflexota bacterium]